MGRGNPKYESGTRYPGAQIFNVRPGTPETLRWDPGPGAPKYSNGKWDH